MVTLRSRGIFSSSLIPAGVRAAYCRYSALHILSLPLDMPPRTNIIQPSSITPPPSQSADAQDLLVIQDVMDTLDQIPPELTRVHSDLNELGAVLYCESQLSSETSHERWRFYSL